jgi:2-dehydro-3-deoxyphosphogluconate aldolase/(4S)-4-hydroxy-2-oxoglutarate aldolase
MTRVMDIAEAAVIARLAQTRIIALAAVDDPEQVEKVGESVSSGGVPCLELAHARLGSIRAARRVSGLLVGVGNVQSPDAAEIVARGGAHFATSPVTDMEVIHACRELELPFFPGVATPSEIGRLAALGVRTVRLFPVDLLGGPAFVEAVASVYPDMRFIPSGTIGPESLRGYLKVPSVLAVAGNGLVRTDLVRTRHYERIEWLAGEAVRARGLVRGFPVPSGAGGG